MAAKKRVAIVGFGNVGRAAFDALLRCEDMEPAAVVRRDPAPIPEASVEVVGSLDEVEGIDGALLCLPTRRVAAVARQLLERGIATVDSFDLHGGAMTEHRRALDRAARDGGVCAIVGAGWDPGTDSVVRALLLAMAPEGESTTTFGPGMSMGHSVAAKAVPGVKDAISLTLPAGPGVHRRKVFVSSEDPSREEEIRRAIQMDPYFSRDETEVVFVEDVSQFLDPRHGVRIEREGASAAVFAQRFHWEMRIHNPALTSQVMVGAMRAAFRQDPGCRSLIEVPVIDLLPGERERWIESLV